jgi:hypothetical protein
MKYRIRALLGAGALALLVAPAAAVAKPGKTVTIRVEGVSKTLLAPTAVKVPTSGWITKGHTPKGACSATTAAGALDVATHHRWNGTWEANYNAMFVTSVLGQRYGSKAKDYWSIWVNGRYAQSGICNLKLHKGDQLLFAAVSTTGNSLPLILRTSASRTHVGSRVTITAGYAGKHGLTPVAGVKVSAGGVTEQTDKKGHATFTIAHTGTLVVRGDAKGYIRAAPLKVTELP